MRRLLFLVTACGSPAAPPKSPAPMPPATPALVAVQTPVSTEPSTRLIEGAHCAIRDRNIKLASPLQLMVQGKRFAIVDEVTELEVRAAAIGATATLATAELRITGDVDLKRQQVRPRAAMQGWFAIRSATPGSVSDDKLALDVKLPATVTPATAPFVRVACTALTFAAPLEVPAEGKQVSLKLASKFPLRADPKGPVIATIETPRIDAGTADDKRRRLDSASLSARELARDGKLARIRTGSVNYVEGWVDASNLTAATTVAVVEEAPARARPVPKHAVRCLHEVAIYVRDGNDLIRVGVYEKNALIKHHERRKDDVPVDLGLLPKLPIEPVGGDPEVEPFVRASALADCR